MEDVGRLAVLDQRHHLARDVDLDVAAVLGVDGLELGVATKQQLEQRGVVCLGARHLVDLAHRHDRQARGLVLLVGDLLAHVVPAAPQQAVEQQGLPAPVLELLGNRRLEGDRVGDVAAVHGLGDVVAAALEPHPHPVGAGHRVGAKRPGAHDLALALYRHRHPPVRPRDRDAAAQVDPVQHLGVAAPGERKRRPRQAGSVLVRKSGGAPTAGAAMAAQSAVVSAASRAVLLIPRPSFAADVLSPTWRPGGRRRRRGWRRAGYRAAVPSGRRRGPAG